MKNVVKWMFLSLSLIICSYLVLALSVVNVVSPTTGQNVSGNLLLNATTDAGADNVTFYFYGSTSGVLGYNITILNDSIDDTVFNTTLVTSLLLDGTYNITVNATNTTGDTVSNSSITLVTVDNTAPSVTAILTPANGVNLSTVGPVYIFNATVTDATLGLQTVLFNITNSTGFVLLTASNPSGNFWNASVDLSTLVQEVHTVTVLANDSLGNLNNSVTSTFTTDGTAPTVTLITANNSNFTTTTPAISFNFTDAIFATASCSVYADGSLSVTNSSTLNATLTSFTLGTLGQGTHTYYVNCTDGSSNIGQSLTNNLTVDSIAPAVTAINTPTSSQNLTATGTTVFNATVTGASVVQFNITNSTGSVLLTASNPGGNDWNVSIDLSTLAQGVHTLTVLANDTFGNLNNSVTSTFTTDGTAPIVNLVSPATANITSSASVNFIFNYTDAIFSNANCTFYLNGVANQSNSSTLNATSTTFTKTLNDGSYSWYVNCTDGSNNIGGASSRTLMVDTTYPISLINAVNTKSSGEWTNNRTLQINITGTDTNINYWNVTVYNSTAGGVTSNQTSRNISAQLVTLNVTLDGNYTVNLTVMDNASLSNVSTFLIRVDNTAPETHSLSTSSVTATGATLTVNASDASSGIVNCTYSIAAGSGSLTLSSGLYTATLSSLTASTAYTVNVTCTDNATNTQSNTTSLTTIAASSSSSSSSSGGGGSTGASGGVSNGAIGQFEQRTWTSVNAGETATVSVPNGEIGVTEVSFGLSKTLYGVWMKVAKLDSLPSDVKVFNQKVYRYIEVTKSLTFKESDFKTAQIDFKVKKTWLTDNKLGKENVALYRYVDSKWTELKTTLGTDDGTYFHYSASTPGFSYFIIGQNGIPATVIKPTIDSTTNPVVEPVAITPVESSEVVLIIPSKNATWKWVVGVVLLLVLVVLIALSLNKKSKKRK